MIRTPFRTAPAGPDEPLRLFPRLGRTRLELYKNVLKPILDRVIAALLLFLLFPMLLSIALAILVTMGRPVLFLQQRVGQNGGIFKIIKFRTMVADRRLVMSHYVEPERRKVHKSISDPRMTTVGRFLRKTSMDELPQLINIVLGHMSLVGPRPELVTIVRSYQPWQHRRHDVKPGLTGLWQVSLRNGGLMHENVELDLAYVDRVSFLNDFKIIADTIPVVLGRRPGF